MGNGTGWYNVGKAPVPGLQRFRFKDQLIIKRVGPLNVGWNRGGGTSGAFLTATSFPTPEVTQESTTITQSLICRAGVIPATFGALGEFHSNALDSISAGFYTLSGTSQVRPVVIADGKISPVGAAGVPPVAPVVITGWL